MTFPNAQCGMHVEHSLIDATVSIISETVLSSTQSFSEHLHVVYMDTTR